MQRLFTRREAAQRLGVQPGTLAKWAYLGIGPKFFKLGGHGRAMYPESSVVAYLRSLPVGGGGVPAAGEPGDVQLEHQEVL